MKSKNNFFNARNNTIIAVIFMCIILFTVFVFSDDKDLQKNTIQEATDMAQDIAEEIIVTEETQKIVDETISATYDNKDLSTNEIIQSSEDEEQNVFDEGALETDAVVEQENISYDGDNTGNGLSLLGSYQGLTYYSQADSRWANVMYSSIGDSSQTMKSSACGPTSAAIVVSSSKGTILPTTMANLAVDNGYRTANNGTAWAYYSFVADYFDFDEYYTTSNFNTAMNYLKTDNDNDGNADYYIIVSCGSGLFTTGGHYIVLVGNDNETIQVYDPYLYNGKFNTASRRNAGVVVSGNSAFVSETSFKNYANAKNYWIFSNDEGNGNTNTNTSATVNYIRYVSTQSANLNVRSSANGSIINSLKKGTQVTVVEVKNGWSRITSPVTGWVSNTYLSSTYVGFSTYNTVGQTRKTKACYLYSNANLTGTKYTYKANTTVTILSNISNSVDRVRVNLTGREAYINTSDYSTSSSSNNSGTAGQYKRLANRTYLYSNSNLTGKVYTYLPLTQVKIIRNVSNTVDYVYVVKTGRYAYVRSNSYR